MIAPGRPSFREHFAASRAQLLVIGLTIFAIYLPALTIPYAFSDDYSFLWMAASGEPSPHFGSSILSNSSVGGRPFAGLISTALFSAADTIDNLRFVRLLAVVSIIALAVLFHWALARARIRPGVAALITILLCSLPAFQVFASWTVLVVGPIAALIGASASLLTVSAVDAPHPVVVDRFLGATAMLLAGLLVYQPAAMIYWVFFALALTAAVDDSRRIARLARAHFAVAAAALPLAFLVQRLGVHIAGSDASNAARGTLTHDVAGKATWFVHAPLERSLNLFDLTPSRAVTALVAATALLGIAMLLRHRAERPLLLLTIASALVPLAYLPNLVTQQNSATYRTMVALSSLIALYACLGALGIWLAIRGPLRIVARVGPLATNRAAFALAAGFVALGALAAAKNVTTLFADPQMTELRLIRSQVARLPDGADRVGFVGTSYHEGMSELVVGDEFGIPSTSKTYIARPALLLLLREQGRLGPTSPRPSVDTFLWYRTTFPKGEPVIDVRRQLRRLR